MPNIRTYNVGDVALHPTETGVDAFAQAGRRINSIYDQVASAERQGGNALAEGLGQGIAAAGDAYVRLRANQQVSAGMPAALNLKAELQQQANDITKNADPNDTSVYGKFRETILEPALEKFVDGFDTENSRRWAEEQANGIREHMQRTIAADQSTMASIAVRQNLNQSANIASNLVAQNPDALASTLDMLKHSTAHVVASSPNISPEDAARVNGDVLQTISQHVVKSAISGAILKNPDAGLAMSRDPRYAQFVDGAEVNAFYKEAVRANRADALLQKQLQHEQLEKNSDAAEQQVMSSYFNPDPTAERIPVKDILALDNVTAAAKSRMLNIAFNAANKLEVSPAQSAENSAALMHDIWNGKITDIGTLRDQLANNKIRYGDYQNLEKEFLNPQDPATGTLRQSRADFFRSYTAVVNPIYADGTRDPENARREYNLFVAARQQEAAVRAKGGDPADIYDPFSKDFIGRSPLARPVTPAEHKAYYSELGKQKDIPDALNPEKAPVPVKTPDDVAKLPKSVQFFLTPDGRRKLNPNYQAQ